MDENSRHRLSARWSRTGCGWKVPAAVVLGVWLLAGCGSSDDASAASSDLESLGFVGTVEGTDAFVSVMVADSDTGLYEVDDTDATADGVWAAWVVGNDGNERGAFLRSGAFQATPRLSSTTFKLSRFSVSNGIIQMNGIVAPNN